MAEIKAKEKIGDWAFRIEGPIVLIPTLLLLGPIGYAIYTRTVTDFLRVPLTASLVMTTVLLTLSSPSLTLPKNFTTMWSCLKQIGATWIFSVAVSLLLFGIGVSLIDAFQSGSGAITYNGKFSLAIGIITLFLGSAFFWARAKWRVTYGISEAFFGVAIASHRAYGEPSFWTNDSFSFYAAILTAGIYLVVRGLDNVNQGCSLPGDPLLRLWNWFKAKTFTTDPLEVKKFYGQEKVERK